MHQVYVLIEGEKLLATATLLIEPKLLHEARNVGHIEDVVVSKEARGKGYGKILVRFLSAVAEQ